MPVPWTLPTRRSAGPGKNISLITYGGTLFKTLQAAEELEREGIDAEVIDLRTLRPLDTATMVDSVSRTHRAVIIDEGWRTREYFSRDHGADHGKCFLRA